jgi:hypothetical protein
MQVAVAVVWKLEPVGALLVALEVVVEAVQTTARATLTQLLEL